MSTTTSNRLSTFQRTGLLAGGTLMVLATAAMQCTRLEADAGAAQVLAILCTNLVALCAALLIEDRVGDRLRQVARDALRLGRPAA
ncbi:MAG: hypothetical protein AB7L71_02435 [Vicinamibacterales bacterium]